MRGKCDGPHAGQFRYRDYEMGEHSADGGLTWISGGPYIGADGTNWTNNRPVMQAYTTGERNVDNGDGPEAGMHRYRYTRDSSDPQARLVGYYIGCPGLGSRVGTLASPATCFVDVEGSSVHAENIQHLVERQITEGCGGGRFCPSRTVTRAQMAAFLHRAVYGPQEVSEPPALFDVPSDAWYRTFALWAVKHDVIRAPGGRFDPAEPVTRADMAEMLVAVFRISVPDRAQGLFDDTTGLSDAVVRDIEGIRTAKVTAGCATGPLRYCPGQTVTRAQMASFLVPWSEPWALELNLRSASREPLEGRPGPASPLDRAAALVLRPGPARGLRPAVSPWPSGPGPGPEVGREPAADQVQALGGPAAAPTARGGP